MSASSDNHDTRLRLLIEQLPAVMWTTDLDLRFTSSLGAGLAPIGLQPEQSIGQALHTLVGTDDANHPRIAAHRRALAGESVTYQDEFAGRFYHSRVDPLRDADDRIIGCIGVAHDITEIRQAQEQLRQLNQELEQRITHRTAELRQSNHRLRQEIDDRRLAEKQLRLVQSAVDHVTDSVVITDADLEAPGPRIIYVNPAFERMSGYTADQVLGRSPRLLQGPRTDRAVLDAVRESLVAGQPYHGETINYRNDGSEFILEWRMAPIRGNNGRISHWVAIQRDITERRSAEQAAEQRQAELAHVARLSTMGEMASGLAHELNQPLAAILSYAQGCLRRIDAGRADPPALRDAVLRIAAQAQRAGQVIQRLRHFVRKREPRRTPTDLNELVREAAGLMDGEARRHGVRIQFELAPDLPLVLTDSIQIEQVVLNLLRNAIEALMMAGVEAPCIIVRSEEKRAQGQVWLEVRDNGPGISPQHVDHIFSPFYTTKPHGMGMGLTISTTIVEAHGGRLWATSNPGGGVTFHLMLPLPSPQR